MRGKRAAALALGLLLAFGMAGAEGSSLYTLADKNVEGIYELGETGWLVEYWKDFELPERTRSLAGEVSRAAEACGVKDTYVYLVNSSRSLDLDHPEREAPLMALLRECFPDSTVGCLEVGSVEAYCGYFYKTDHHWNYKASYRGYTDVIRMMLGEDEPLLEPLETVEFPFMFNGAYNRRLLRADSDEAFTVYRFAFPEMKIWINGIRRKTYGRADSYFSGDVDGRYVMANHYGEFYGGDVGRIEFDTGRPEKENVLILSNSYSNAVNLLIASHFNVTVVVDPRLYQEENGEELVLGRLIRNYGITKILLLGDASFFGRAQLQ